MADYFTTFIQNLLGTPSPTGSMFGGTFVDPQTGMVDRTRLTGDAADYYADPFRKQNAIQQASLDAALKQKEAEQAVQKVQGMFSGDGGPNADLNPYVAAYLDAGGGEAGMQAQQAAQYATFLQSPPFVQGLMESLMPDTVNQMANSWYNETYGKTDWSQGGAEENVGGVATSIDALSDENIAYGGVTDFSYDGGGGGVSPGGGGDVGSIGGVSLGGGDPSGVGFGTGGF
jgi:hypothetical protein